MQLTPLDDKTLQHYHANGYIVVPQLFAPEEVSSLKAHFMALRAQGSHPGDMVADIALKNDPLQQYPRMIHMHRWDEISLNWLLDARLNHVLTALLGCEPYAVQSMLYFKPPGARGQAVHQDNYYLRARPGTCMAAWLALDDSDEENGCIQVVPGSHNWPLLCPAPADSAASFTGVTVPLPSDLQTTPVVMQPGEVLFFNGILVHGSNPNASATRFRRALIGHYIDGRAEQVTKFDQPILRMDGTELTIEDGEGGAPCGVWTEQDGAASIQLSGTFGMPSAHE